MDGIVGVSRRPGPMIVSFRQTGTASGEDPMGSPRVEVVFCFGKQKQEYSFPLLAATPHSRYLSTIFPIPWLWLSGTRAAEADVAAAIP
jgi:hypothetical protein